MVLGPRLATLILLVFTAAAPAALAQSIDTHVISDPAAALYKRSSFAHGYRHGYEEGFRIADRDYHLGREPQLLACSEKKIKNISSPKVRGYEKRFGDKANFSSGYEHGYIAGYTDSYNGRMFRVLELHLAALKTSPNVQAENADLEFDRGFGDGYRSFSFHAQAPTDTDKCPKDSPNYCDGFDRGVVVGRADANVANDSLGHVLAQK